MKDEIRHTVERTMLILDNVIIDVSQVVFASFGEAVDTMWFRLRGDTQTNQVVVTRDEWNLLREALKGVAYQQHSHCPHQWKTQLQGGDPQNPDAREVVTVCELCGAHGLDDD